MLSLKILLAVGLVAALLATFFKFNAHCEHKFRYRFFTKEAYFFAVFADILILFGISVWQSAVTHHGDKLNGVVIIALGIGVLGWLFYRNFRETNFLYGLLGSALQIVLLAFVGGAALPFVVMLFFVRAVLFSDAMPVYIVNK